MVKDIFGPPSYAFRAHDGDISVVMLYYTYVICFFAALALSLIYVVGYATYEGGTHVLTFRVEIAWIPMFLAIMTSIVALGS
ncbi:MAG: hypothetical protein AAF633_27450, partial [Chloroflexota bacterium]